MATDITSKKRRWQSTEGGKKSRPGDENSPRKRRRVKTVESPNSSPFVTDSDEAPTFRTKSFYRSKGQTKFASMPGVAKENLSTSPRKKLTPLRRASSRLKAVAMSGSGSESSSSVCELPYPMSVVPKGHLKSMTSADSDSETNIEKVLRTRNSQNDNIKKSEEYDFSSVKPVQTTGGGANVSKTGSAAKKTPENKTHTPPLKKSSGKKLLKTKCPSSAPKNLGRVIVHKGFDLKFVARRISDEFADKKKKTPNSEKLEFMKQRLEARLRSKNSENSPKSAKKTVMKMSEDLNLHLPESQDSAIGINGPSQPSTSEFPTSVATIERLSLSGSQDLYSDAVSETSEANSYASGPSQRSTRTSPRKKVVPDSLAQSYSQLDNMDYSSGPSQRSESKQNQIAEYLSSACHRSPRRLRNPDSVSSQVKNGESPSRRSLRIEKMSSPSQNVTEISSSPKPASRRVLELQDSSPSKKGSSSQKSESSTRSPVKSRVSELQNSSPSEKGSSSQKSESSTRSPVKSRVLELQNSSPSEKGSSPVKSSSVTKSDKPLFSIFNTTPNQRKSLRNLAHKSPSITSLSPRPSPKVSPNMKKFLKDKNIGVEQMMLDAGQKKFGATVCDVCGMVYTHADPIDETTHAKFHTNLINTLKFPGWKKERIVEEFIEDGSKIIMVLNDDPKYATRKISEINKIMGQELGFPDQNLPFTSNYKGFLYISEDKNIQGCCIAESIQEGYRVITDPRSKSPSKTSESQQRPWYCDTESERASIGISKIWVYKQSRQKGIASRLLDTIRTCFHYGGVVERNQLAFSDPTPDGKKFATKYTGSPAFLVYKYIR